MTLQRRPYLAGYPDPDVDLAAAFTAAASMQSTIRQADAKATSLLGVMGAAGALTVNQALPQFLASPDEAVLGIGAGLTAILLTSAAITAWQLISALRPRIDSAPVGNRFALRQMELPRGVGSLRERRDDAWDLVAVLAGIARAKHERIQRSVPTTGVALAASALLVLVGACVSSVG